MLGRRLTYSQTIFVMKIMLPAVAILLIISVFALSRGQTDQQKLPFSPHEITQRLKEQAIDNPLYIGSTQNGTEVRVSAKRLIPIQGDQKFTTFHTVHAEFVKGRLPIGVITAEQARLDTSSDIVEFIGNVVMTDNDTRRVTADKLHTNGSMTNSVFEGSVKLMNGQNSVTSDKLEVYRQSASSPRRFVFTERVKMIYNPWQ